MMLRRTFAKLGAILVGGAPVINYAEPLAIVRSTAKDWVEDCGDFYVVRVPASGVFARETMDKPTLILAGPHSIIRDCEFNGFVNARSEGRLAVIGCKFDVLMSRAAGREAIIDATLGDGGHFYDCHFIGHKDIKKTIEFRRAVACVDETKFSTPFGSSGAMFTSTLRRVRREEMKCP